MEVQYKVAQYASSFVKKKLRVFLSTPLLFSFCTPTTFEIPELSLMILGDSGIRVS